MTELEQPLITRNFRAVTRTSTLRQALAVLGLVMSQNIATARRYDEPDILLYDARKAWKELMSVHHTDHGGNNESATRINLAMQRVEHFLVKRPKLESTEMLLQRVAQHRKTVYYNYLHRRKRLELARAAMLA